jgi:hypothetical protein
MRARVCFSGALLVAVGSVFFCHCKRPSGAVYDSIVALSRSLTLGVKTNKWFVNKTEQIYYTSVAACPLALSTATTTTT